MNSLGNKKEQSEALVGLALHILQDHFAHLTRLYVYKGIPGNTKYIGNMAATTFSNSSNKYVKSEADFEDNVKQLSWRYNNTKKVTSAVYEYYKSKKKINKIEEKKIGGVKSYYFYAKKTKINYILYSTEYYLVIS